MFPTDQYGNPIDPMQNTQGLDFGGTQQSTNNSFFGQPAPSYNFGSSALPASPLPQGSPTALAQALSGAQNSPMNSQLDPMGMFQPKQNDFSNYQDSFMGPQAMRNPDGSVMQDMFGNPIMEKGMTGMDMMQSGMGVAQMGMGFYMDDRKLDVAEDNLKLKRTAYNDLRGDKERQRNNIAGYGQKPQERTA